MNPAFCHDEKENAVDVMIYRVCEEAKLDEQWSFVGNKSNQRWLWYAIDHVSNNVLAYALGKRKDSVFKQLKSLLEPGLNAWPAKQYAFQSWKKCMILSLVYLLTRLNLEWIFI